MANKSTIKKAIKESLRRIKIFTCENNVSQSVMTYCKYGNWTGLSEMGWKEGVCQTCRAIDQEFEWVNENWDHEKG